MTVKQQLNRVVRAIGQETKVATSIADADLLSV
jgi:hypothetical protein